MAIKTSPIFSIIIPVYNTELYLERCLDSILNLDEKNFEAILIDDGSTDDSGRICDQYAAKDQRFHVIHQRNKGVSAARNTGLDLARGEWVCMVDSDDEMSPDYFNIFESEEIYDIIVRSFVIYDSNGNLVHKTKIRKREIVCGIYEVKRFSIDRMENTLWDKIIKRNIIGDLRLNENIKIEEDYLFALSIIQRNPSIILSPVGEYCQHQHSDSAMGLLLKNNNAFLDTKITAIEEVHKMLIEADKDYLYSLLFGRFFPFLAGVRHITTLNERQNEKLLWFLSEFNLFRLKYLSITQRIDICIRVLMAQFIYIIKKWF